jgi:hypothetical protein
MSVFLVKIVLALYAIELLILSEETLTYLELNLFLLIILYNGIFLITKILIVFEMNVYINIYNLSLHNS